MKWEGLEIKVWDLWIVATEIDQLVLDWNDGGPIRLTPRDAPRLL
ncbi:hypothetical protein [Allomuricauda sp. SCSIO 64092]|nr:hypothetical protein [Muricauda sp. SCSIO 64092]